MEELRERNDTLKEEKIEIESQRDEEAGNIFDGSKWYQDGINDEAKLRDERTQDEILN